jgi:hypothetical protein
VNDNLDDFTLENDISKNGDILENDNFENDNVPHNQPYSKIFDLPDNLLEKNSIIWTPGLIFTTLHFLTH